MASATGLRDAEYIIFNNNRGRSVALWSFRGRVFHPAQRPVSESARRRHDLRPAADVLKN